MKKWTRYLLWGTVVLVLTLGTGFFLWAYDTNPVMFEALAALETDDAVQVENTQWIVFSPQDHEPESGVIFYPGGRVDPQAYAPTMRSLAENGYLAVIIPMPLNLAITGVNRADPSVHSWAVGGHSLGGVMAANYIYNHPDQGLGLFLFAGYSTESNDLSGIETPVLAVYGSEDGLVEVEQGIERLPQSAQIVVIQGGNHAQFGYYGVQDGDGTATIDWDEQQTQILATMLDFLE